MEGIKRLRPGGLFLFTCASEGRPEHGTKATSPEDSPATTGYYKNLTEQDIRAVSGFNDLWEVCWFEQKETDLRFFGIKRGGEGIRFGPSRLRWLLAYLNYWFSRRKKDTLNVIRKGPTSSQIYKALVKSLEK